MKVNLNQEPKNEYSRVFFSIFDGKFDENCIFP